MADEAHRITTLLPVDAETALPRFEARARAIGFACARIGGRLRVTLSGGTATVGPAPGGTALAVTAEDGLHLQMLRDYLTEELQAAGLRPLWQGPPGDGWPASHARTRVVAVRRLSPSYRRVILAGADLARFDAGGLHFRLLLGPPGADWPRTDDNGVTQWPGGAAAWHKPVYTIRHLDLTLPEPQLAFDVFLHAGGRVTGWTAGLRPGTEVALAGPGGDRGPRPAAWHGLVGDETALPVIARHLALLPADARGAALIVVPDRADIQTLIAPPELALRWLLRAEGATPLAALAELSIPDTGRAVFFAAEQAEAQAARQALLARGLAKSEFTAAGYWNAATAPGET